MTKEAILHEMANRPSEGRMTELLHALWRCDHPLPNGLKENVAPEDTQDVARELPNYRPPQVITKPLDAPSRRRGRQ